MTDNEKYLIHIPKDATYIEILGHRIDGYESKEKNKMENKKVIIRADRAGVFYGEIKKRNKDEVVMTDVKRLWYWDGAASLSQLATEGVTRPNNCKFTVTVPEMTILGVIEIIPCTEKAVESIESVRVWKR